MNVKKLNRTVADAQGVPSALDRAGIEFIPINTVNWEAYPYRPEVEFRIAHSDEAIHLHYRVSEKSARAKYGEDAGKVWTDSCVEFFSIPGGDNIYYNLECNCIGTILLAAGSERNDREMASVETMKKVLRWSSLGTKTFDEKIGSCRWELALIVPYAVFFKHRIVSLDKQLIRANFYKCGDELKTPHFLSWNPIQTNQPDFHRPEFFGELYFE